MSASAKDKTEDEGGEFAEFMADVSREIAQRVQSIEMPAVTATPTRAEMRKTPGASDPTVISEWEDLSDRMIEEMR
jgi:hypothetical protein